MQNETLFGVSKNDKLLKCGFHQKKWLNKLQNSVKYRYNYNKHEQIYKR